MNCLQCNQWLPGPDDLEEPGKNGQLSRLYYAMSLTDDNKLICCRCGYENPILQDEPPTYERIIAAVTDGKSYLSIVSIKRRK